MDQQLIPLEPNLKFVSELKEDLKTKYFQLHEKAKETLEGFLSTTVQNLYLELRKLLIENIECHVTIERLRQIINKSKCSQDHISSLNNNPFSEILGSSPNCSLKSLLTSLNVDEKKEEKECSENKKSGEYIEKENLNDVDIFTEDFADAEDNFFENHKSPVQSEVVTPVKVQNSPVFSKRKRSRKSHSLISNNSSHSIASSNDSKVSLTNTVNNVSTLDKNIVEIDTESDKEIEKESNKEPLKAIDNIYSSITPTKQSSKDCKLLRVSKTNFGKTEFTEKGKRFRQTTLTLKKPTPVIDISRDNDETNCSINDTKSNVDFHWNKSYFNNKKTNTTNTKEFDISKKPLKVKGDTQNNSFKMCSKDANTSTKDDELIETSPAYNEKSKLRNKLNLPKKIESQFKVRTQHMDSETVSDLKNVTKNNKLKYSHENSSSAVKSCDLKSNPLTGANIPTGKNIPEERRSFEPQRTVSDETYFSLAELTANKNDFTDCDMTEFEDEGKEETPPAKRMLLNSFDIVPSRKEKSPDYAYKEKAVRNKNERAQLPGWDCRDCKQWYGHLPEEERKKKQNQCSKHRGKYKADVLTPESFWNPVFDDTNDSSVDY